MNDLCHGFQEHGDFIYIGIIQSSAAGHPLFLHRTGGNKLSWDDNTQSYFTTHVSAPISSIQANSFVYRMLAASGHLNANETRLVQQSHHGSNYPPILVAPIQSLSRPVCRILSEISILLYKEIYDWIREDQENVHET